MNGYELLASSYRSLLERGEVSKQSAKEVIDELGDLFNFPCEEICNNK